MSVCVYVYVCVHARARVRACLYVCSQLYACMSVCLSYACIIWCPFVKSAIKTSVEMATGLLECRKGSVIHCPKKASAGKCVYSGHFCLQHFEVAKSEHDNDIYQHYIQLLDIVGIDSDL